MKSTVASVALPAWILGHDPTAKIIGITYGAELTSKFSFDFRRILNSDFYLRTFVDTCILDGKNTDTEVVLTAGGSWFGTSITGAITGRGADFIICDDPMKAQDVSSDVRRETAIEVFQNTILTRLDNQVTGAFVVVMQRLHANDFVGALLARSDNWTVLNLPALAEEEQTVQIDDEQFYVREAGELLHAERLPLSVLTQIRDDMGPDAFEAQYQQRPIPRGGLIIQADWIRHHTIKDHKAIKGGKVIQSWDTAGKIGARNSFSVCTTWLKADGQYYLLDLIRGRFNYVTLKDTACEYAHRFRPNVILVEDASTGTALAAELQKAVPFVVKPVPVRLDKVDRLFEQQGKFASGRVHFPKDAPFLPELLRELLSFPQSKTTDQVDSISQALAYQGSDYTLDNVR
jgi:predicted phage terminase large subunit-like protein